MENWLQLMLNWDPQQRGGGSDPETNRPRCFLIMDHILNLKVSGGCCFKGLLKASQRPESYSVEQSCNPGIIQLPGAGGIVFLGIRKWVHIRPVQYILEDKISPAIKISSSFTFGLEG